MIKNTEKDFIRQNSLKYVFKQIVWFNAKWEWNKIEMQNENFWKLNLTPRRNVREKLFGFDIRPMPDWDTDMD